MSKKSPVAIFMAATALMVTTSHHANIASAGDQKSNLGGLKEWTTDQDIDEESTLDEEAKNASEKAKKENVCIPIGEGENCW